MLCTIEFNTDLALAITHADACERIAETVQYHDLRLGLRQS